MFDYENGLFVAFLFYLFDQVRLVVMKNSIYEKNLNKLGQRLSWASLAPKPIYYPPDKNTIYWNIGKFILLQIIGIASIFLSWINVGLRAAMFIYYLAKNAGMPQNIKEFIWKLKNIDMTFDQLLTESMKVNGLDPADFEEYKQTILNELKERGL